MARDRYRRLGASTNHDHYGSERDKLTHYMNAHSLTHSVTHSLTHSLSTVTLAHSLTHLSLLPAGLARQVAVVQRVVAGDARLDQHYQAEPREEPEEHEDATALK